MPELVFISDLEPGDMIDLEDDVWADTPTSMTEPSKYAGEYSIVESTAQADEEWVDVKLESGEVIAFPEDHQVRKMRR
jgi:hypothetical protein